MRADTRHELKHDRFAVATADTLSWAAEHRAKITTALVVLAVLLVAGIGGWVFLQRRNQAASADLGDALRTLHAELREAGAAARPNVPSFTSVEERAKAAQDKFRAVRDKYSWTAAADVAEYYLGLTAYDLGNTAEAEQALKKVADGRNRDLAALGKYALANIYRASGKQKEAIDILQQLIDKPANSVPKVTAQLELASVYEGSRPADAVRLYEQIKTENPKGGPAVEQANARLAAVKR
jgi:tetratricopeptide (TPR) repeat protein